MTLDYTSVWRCAANNVSARAQAPITQAAPEKD
jgi:hypothetical protein